MNINFQMEVSIKYLHTFNSNFPLELQFQLYVMNVNGPIHWSKSTSKMRSVSGFGWIILIAKDLWRTSVQLLIQRCQHQTYFLLPEPVRKRLSGREAFPEENLRDWHQQCTALLAVQQCSGYSVADVFVCIPQVGQYVHQYLPICSTYIQGVCFKEQV